jgi:hypothetical protein
MILEELFLKKEELPILHETCFHIPIHPRLFNEDLRNYEDLAKDIFPKVAKEWCKELGKDKFPSWDNLIKTNENGLVTGFQISRDYGGGLYFDKDDSNCETLIANPYIIFSKGKIQEFEHRKLGEFPISFIYAKTNIDHYPAALFLRNWAIEYMNEVFKQVF